MIIDEFVISIYKDRKSFWICIPSALDAKLSPNMD